MPARPLDDRLAKQAVSMVEECGGNLTEAASRLKLSRNTLLSRVRVAKTRGMVPKEPPEATYKRNMKLLLLDIETAPNLASVWGLWNQNISLNQLIEPGYTLCWAAKWHGQDKIMFDSILSGPRKMIKSVHALMSEADAIIHYNGNNFDIPTLAKEFLLHDLPPPTPAKQIDLLLTARKRFRLASNKLDFIAQQLGIGAKEEHKGHKLWLECMNKDKKAWKVMESYNKNDVVLLEKVYDRLLPWILQHPNMSLFGDTFCCPTCGGTDYTQHKTAMIEAAVYRRYQCNSCSKWFRLNVREKTQRTRAMPI